MRLILFFLIWMIFWSCDVAFAKHKIIFAQLNSRLQPIGPSLLNGVSQLNVELNRIIASEELPANVAVYVKSMKYGDSLFALNINVPLTPASTLKVLTAEAALLFLGAEYRFSTQLLTDAKTIKNGILQGNLYVVLSGDPSLTYYDLADLLVTLKSQQIQGIAGNVYIDNTAYDQSFYGPGWDAKDKGYCFAAPISASIINHNCLPFKLAPSKIPGHSATVITSPRYFYPTIRSSVVTKAKQVRSCSIRLASHAGNPGAMILIDGCVPRGEDGYGVSYVVTDVPEYNRALFKNLLVRFSIKVYGNVTFGSAPELLSLIGQHVSQPLRVLITDMLKKSDNVIAGALFKKLGQLYTKKPGSWQNGSFAVSQILAKQAGVRVNGMRILDGSGLSPNNLATPAQMMQVLDFAFHHDKISLDFITSLPIAGVDGTLKHRMSHLARKVRAKTGTISGVASLAGYTISADREPLAFVIIINGTKADGWRYRELEDRIVTALTRYRR